MYLSPNKYTRPASEQILLEAQWKKTPSMLTKGIQSRRPFRIQSEGFSGSLDSRQKVVRAEQMVVAAAWIKYGSGVDPADRH